MVPPSDPSPGPEGTSPPDDGRQAPREQRRARRRRRRLAALPPRTRIALFLVGWLLVLLGVAGLFLPGLQGILTIVAGAAVLSLVSELVYEWMRALLERWPGVWRRIEAFRLRFHRRLARRRRKPPGVPPREG